MKKFLSAFFLSVLVSGLLATVGCSTEDISTNAALSQEPVNGSGLSLKDAKKKSINLMPGMTQNAVRELMGDPDSTSSSTYGFKTTNPWIGVEWDYVWKVAYSPPPKLSIVFSKQGNAWSVSSWEW
jgi:outer membrane protein assembly factor BamE (lipoprotein component of BamABCDE complex)